MGITARAPDRTLPANEQCGIGWFSTIPDMPGL
jgi:hypothetical protein